MAAKSAPRAPPGPRHKPPAIRIDPTTNALLTAVFGLEVLAIFALIFVPGALPAGCPLGPEAAAAALAAACVTLYPVILLVKCVAGYACALVSRTLLAHLGNPVRKAKTRNKLRDQSWQLFIHCAMTALEVRPASARLVFGGSTVGWRTTSNLETV